ncbi:MAG: enoyl-CoA hydratase-related protein [Actinomycetota bacterium]
MSGPEVVKIERHGRVLELTINRPEVLNALDHTVMTTLVAEATAADADPEIGCILITGSGDRAFAAGADISELRRHTYRSMTAANVFAPWDDLAALRIPKVAAVNGYALGGGCELAMMCDVILAGESARFGQPEIKLGLIPGMGGTQRLTRLVGRAKAMDLILTGRMMRADEAERAGLVSRVVANGELLATAREVAATIGGFARHVTTVATEAVDRAEQTSLAEGVLFERRSYYALFDTPEAHEGMDAFLAKREPAFNPAPKG